MYYHYGSETYLSFVQRSTTSKVICVLVCSTLYWTYRDGYSNYGRSLQYMHLSDIDTITTIPLGGRRIRGLTFEPYAKSLYWISHSGVIERYMLNSGNISTVAENAGDVAGVH